MDDTQQSRASDAGATRKRRSSILKSYRPPRAPFSELEFNVATPTDTAKSRRVSFSRRTGVAEFVTNEATTTWKNFYEEHNKSLESSGNDSGANASRQPIGHLGQKRIFEQQFEEVEAVDFITSLDNLAPRNINSTIQVNLTEPLEFTDDKKLTPFENNFELSAFTDHHSKFCVDDLAVPVTGEMSGRIDVNYSAVESLNVKDDLDEIQRDLQSRRNVVGPPVFRDARDFSEYIEVDLNSTHHVIGKNEESDMSITETIKSPKVNVSKSFSPSDQKCNLNWVDDKENCINELKVRTIIYDDNNDMSITTALSSKADQPVLSKSNLNTASSATGLTVEDSNDKHKTILFDDDLGDISITKPLPAKLLSIPNVIKDKTDVDNNLNKSNTQIVEGKTEKRKTILFDDDLGDLSMTKPIPAKLLSVHSEMINKSILNEVPNKSSLQTMDYQTEKHRTILFEDDLGDLSMTKPIPINLPSFHSDNNKSNLNDNTNDPIEYKTGKRKTILFDDGDLSMTKPIPSNLLSVHSEIIDRSNMIDNFDIHKSCYSENKFRELQTNDQLRDVTEDEEPIKEKVTEKRKNILFDDDLGDLSMTKPIPSNLLAISSSKEKIDHNDSSSKSSLQTVEDMSEKRKTIMFEDDLADLSITKPIPSKLLVVPSDSKEKTDFNEVSNKSIVPKIETGTEKRKTILFDDDLGNLSMTKPIPAQLLAVHSDISNLKDKLKETNDQTLEMGTTKHRSIIFDETDLSLTKPIPTKMLSAPNSFIEKPKTNEEYELRKINEILNEQSLKSQTIVHNDDENADMSITVDNMEIDKTMHSSNKIGNIETVNNNSVNMSITKPIPAELITVQGEIIKQECLESNAENKTDVSMSKSIPNDLFDKGDVESNNVTKNELVCSDFSNFKSQDVVVYQVTMNESAKEKRDVSELQDHVSKESDDMIMPSNISVNKSLIPINFHDGPMKEDNTSKAESLKLTSDIKEEMISKNASVHRLAVNHSAERTVSKKSILHDLLDMSNASMSSGLNDKFVNATISSNKPSNPDVANALESEASEMFYITRDTDSEIQSNEGKDTNSYPVVKYVDTTTSDDLPKAMPETDMSIIEDMPEMDVSILKYMPVPTEEKINNSNNNRTVAPILEHETPEKVSMDISKNNSADFDQNKMEISRYPKSFSEADNTKQLLDMLSDLTDGHKTFHRESKSPQSLNVRGQIAIENKTDPRRVSMAPNRQSIVLSREDFLNNISMAQAALQQSIDMEDSDIEEPTPAVAISPPKKTVRVSNEVVKTLQFEDESSGEFSIKCDLISPLKKTAFGETSYMNEGCKANVIPSYLKDVSDGIKSLMNDLVKPMNDELPFEAVGLGKSLKRDTSTCSTQIQANLYTSSQIDMNAELYSNSDILRDVDKAENNTQQAYYANKSPVKSVSFISDVSTHSELVSRNFKEASFRPKRQSPDQTVPGKVLVFDHENPLNNVLLTPTEFTEVHKYCPGESEENLKGPTKVSSPSPSQSSASAKDYEVANVSVRYNVHNFNMICQSSDKEVISENQSITSNISKPRSVDQSICVKVTEVKDIEVNTTIAMKKNKELLESSSSLTLVDDALARSAFDVDIDSPTDSCSNMSDSRTKSPLKVIYKLKHDPKKDKIDSDITSNDEVDALKAKKRVYSPGCAEKCNNTSSQQSVTPKPVAKQQRLSNTPKRDFSLKRISGNKSIIPERDYSSADSKMDVPNKENHRKKSPRKKTSPKKEEVSITVQQLLTEFNVKPEIDQKALNKQILEALSKTDSSVAPDSMSECDSFTSSKNCKRQSSTVTELDAKSATSGDVWAEKVECDSSVNVVAKIDMLPFMGSHECEWASSGTDSWCFQLLHGRLRLVVRLAHRHHNATRTRVRADTPVISVAVHQAHHGNDQKSSVAMSCISFACGALQQYARACACAGDVPALLRRGAALARAALRWGRAMHDARSQLAYTLYEQELILKVANIPLRCVWEVRMRLSLVESPRPHPRADDVRVTRVLDASAARDQRLADLLASVPGDWGHVPTTVWTLFKYLKNKTPQSEELSL